MKKYDDFILAEAYKEHKKCRIVAEQFGCSEETVRRAAIKYGIQRTEHKQKNPPKVQKATAEELREIANEYHQTNCTIQDLAKKYHRAQNTIGKAIREYGDGLKTWDANNRKITDSELIEACNAMTLNEIAEKYNMHPMSLPRRFRKLGCVPIGYCGGENNSRERMTLLNERIKRGEVKKSSGGFKPIFGESWHYVETHNAKMAEQQKGFRYIESRNKGGKNQIKIQCKKCGTVLIRNTSSLNNNIVCELCQKRQKQNTEKQKAVLKLCYTLYALKEIETPKHCIKCGKVFYSQSPSAKYCSKACKANRKRNGSIRKRCRKYKSIYDPNVTTRAVLMRDGYKCQICGKQCDPNDKSWGSFGPDYPTVDHIIPLAKGGTHTWDNVQCACAICNSTKRDLITA